MVGGKSQYAPRRRQLQRHDEGNDRYGKAARLAGERFVGRRKKKRGKKK